MTSSYVEIKKIAEKFYKNKKNGVELLLRECISNAIHACIIKNRNTKNYNPKIHIRIDEDKITIEDNGIGFSEEDKELFCNLAQENKNKRDNKLPSKGLGRLTIAYFTTISYFRTINQEKELFFEYPQENINNLFELKAYEAKGKKDGTILEMTVNKKLLETFIKKYDNENNIQTWLMENFIFLLASETKIDITFTINKNSYEINYATPEILNEKIIISNEEYEFKLFLLESDNINIKLVAHGLSTNSKIKYDRNLKENNKSIFISSDLLDDRISLDGLSIEIDDIKDELEKQIGKILDNYFKDDFKKQKEMSVRMLRKAKKNLPYLAEFMPSEEKINGFKIEQEQDFIKKAIDEKGKAEKDFWNSKEDEQLDERLQKSALYLYVEHRKRIIKLLEKMMADKKFKEDDFHKLLTDRECKNLDIANHNLWLLDDRFSFFTSAYNAQVGEENADVELYYMDNDIQPTQVVLLELKRPVKAYNPGEIIDQIIKYAEKIYKEAKTKGGANIDVKNCKFYGYIIADQEDIFKEVKADNSGNAIRIVNSIRSYEGTYGFNGNNEEVKEKLYLTLLSIQDLKKFALERNEIFFKLLQMPNP